MTRVAWLSLKTKTVWSGVSLHENLFFSRKTNKQKTLPQIRTARHTNVRNDTTTERAKQKQHSNLKRTHGKRQCVLRSQTNFSSTQAELRNQWCFSLHIYIFYLLKTLPRLKLSRSLLFTWLLFNVAGFWERLLHRCSAVSTWLQVLFYPPAFSLFFFQSSGREGTWDTWGLKHFNIY